jgi:hypothetical protein
LRRAQDLEETITQQNNAILAMSSGGHGKEEKSQVNLSVDIVAGEIYFTVIDILSYDLKNTSLRR